MHFRLFFPALSLLLLFGCSSNKSFDLHDGDLLFIVGKSGSQQNNAIRKSTADEKDIPFTHVGIVKFQDENVYVVEAIPTDGVIQTLLYDFIQKTEKQKKKPLMAVGRVKPQYRYLLTQAMENLEEMMAKPYDFAYDEENNAYYCSELVRFAFLDSLQNPIFPALEMTFKNKVTGETEPYWTKHFAGLKLDIPEGMPGTNPVDMAKSPVLEIVHRYYE